MPAAGEPLVSADWLRDRLDDVVVVDVRWYLDGRSGHKAYLEGHIPGAVFADLDTDLSDPPGPQGRHPLPSPEDFAVAMGRLGIGDDTSVVAYDDAGGMVAARLWWMLDSLGRSAAVLDGGIQAWGGPLETTRTTPEPADFTPQPWPRERFVTADEVDARRPEAALLDARSAERHAGVENAIDPRFGHIPGAVSAPFAGNTDDSGRFRPREELEERFAAMGVDEHTEVIAYCGSGVSACSNLLALRLTGVHHTKLYVGSWSEWGADESRPLETAEASDLW